MDNLFEYEEFKSNDNALRLIRALTMSGGKTKLPEVSNEDLSLLKQSVEDNSYKLYRGLYLMKFRLDKGQQEIVNNLNVGDELPDFLKKDFVFNKYSSYTKKLSVAKQYAKEGNVTMIVEANVSKEDILCDLEFMKNIVKSDYFDKNDFAYFKKDKEVIVIEPIKAKIIEIKGKF